VADSEVEPTMNARLGAVLLAGLLLLVLVPAAAAGTGVPPPSALRSASSGSVQGNVTGPSILAVDGTGHYTIRGSGGPAFALNGTQVGNLTYYASVSATNMSGLSIVPGSAALLSTPSVTTLSVSGAAEPVTINVMISSVYRTMNQSINLTYTVNVVTPYVVAAVIVAGTSTTVLSFPVQVTLDDNPVGVVTVPTLTPGQVYNFSYKYITLGLPPGEHTFSLSLANEHGLVHFANGALVYSESFYVEGPAPNYSLWYLAGAVTFFGVLFIFVTRVGARRRGAARR
jgi:hypothetical protein